MQINSLWFVRLLCLGWHSLTSLPPPPTPPWPTCWSLYQAGHCATSGRAHLARLSLEFLSPLPSPPLPPLIISSLRQASVRFLLLLHLMRTESLFMAGQRRFHTGTWKGALSRYFYSPAIHSPAGHRPAAGRSLGVERLRRPDPRTEA